MKIKQPFSVDFIGVGAEKAGTTWLTRMLNAHPEINLSEPKEIFFFNKNNYYDQIHKINPNYQKGLEWYAKRFLHCEVGKIKGEFSTSYLWDESAAKRIYKEFPKCENNDLSS